MVSFIFKSRCRVQSLWGISRQRYCSPLYKYPCDFHRNVYSSRYRWRWDPCLSTFNNLRWKVWNYLGAIPWQRSSRKDITRRRQQDRLFDKARDLARFKHRCHCSVKAKSDVLTFVHSGCHLLCYVDDQLGLAKHSNWGHWGLWNQLKDGFLDLAKRSVGHYYDLHDLLDMRRRHLMSSNLNNFV